MVAEAVFQTKTNQPTWQVGSTAYVPAQRRLSLDEYHSLIDQGFFHPEEKLELIQGILVQILSVNSRHATAVSLISRSYLRRVEDRAEVRIQQPVTLPANESEPEPDFLIAKGGPLTYSERHPYPDEVLLVGEVSDSTLVFDQTTKVFLYAQAGIQEYWIVNIQDSRLEVYRDPEVLADGSASYRTKLTFEPEDAVASLAFPDEELSLDKIFPQ